MPVLDNTDEEDWGPDDDPMLLLPPGTVSDEDDDADALAWIAEEGLVEDGIGGWVYPQDA